MCEKKSGFHRLTVWKQSKKKKQIKDEVEFVQVWCVWNWLQKGLANSRCEIFVKPISS